MLLGKQRRDHFAIADDHDWSSGWRVIFKGVVDAECVIEAGCDIIWREAFVLWHAGRFVAFAKDLAAFDSAAAKDHEHVARIVISADSLVVDLRRDRKSVV